MSGCGNSEVAALRVSDLRLPAAGVPLGGQFYPPPPNRLKFFSGRKRS